MNSPPPLISSDEQVTNSTTTHTLLHIERLYQDRSALPSCLAYLSMKELLLYAATVSHHWHHTITTDRIVWSEMVYHTTGASPLPAHFHSYIRHLHLVGWMPERADRFASFTHVTSVQIVTLGRSDQLSQSKQLWGLLPPIQTNENGDGISAPSIVLANGRDDHLPPHASLKPILSLSVGDWLGQILDVLQAIFHHPRLSQLRQLTIGCPIYKEVFVNAIGELACLEELRVSNHVPNAFYDMIHQLPSLHTLAIQRYLLYQVRPFPAGLTNLSIGLDPLCVGLPQSLRSLVHLQKLTHIDLSLNCYPSRQLIAWLQEQTKLQTLILLFPAFLSVYTCRDFHPLFSPLLLMNQSQLVITSMECMDESVIKLQLERSRTLFESIIQTELVSFDGWPQVLTPALFLGLFHSQLIGLTSLTFNDFKLTHALVDILSMLSPTIRILQFIECGCPLTEEVTTKAAAPPPDFVRTFFTFLGRQVQLVHLQVDLVWRCEDAVVTTWADEAEEAAEPLRVKIRQCTSEMCAPFESCTKLQHLTLHVPQANREPSGFSEELLRTLARMTWVNQLELHGSYLISYQSLLPLLVSRLVNLHHLQLTTEDEQIYTAMVELLKTTNEAHHRPISISINSKPLVVWMRDKEAALLKATQPLESAPTSCCLIQ